MVPRERPAYRKLRGYAFDPSLSLLVDTVELNDMVYQIAWEDKPQLKPGPIGEYIEVVDYDPTVREFYAPVDLNDPYILANDGLDPSESNPQFHQQMVYAVAMTTIQHFEKALGRKILWAPRLLEDRDTYEEYVHRLRIYPHALREANAYYSPQKKAILFGYFTATPATVSAQMPGSLVFTCLSHDIIAHEVTHAILDGLHRNYNRATNPDVLAFHEAFSDIVALFQHFTFPAVLEDQIAKTGGDLGKQNLLGQLAQQFGRAVGRHGSLRDALGQEDPETGEWEPAVPNPSDYLAEMEPHARGSILVAAVFEAYIAIYRRRIQPLLRVASGGTGILPEGELSKDLVDLLSEEAAKIANHILAMCIRALDYCPPVDITFGDYLRAIITADHDIVDDDKHHYRLAFVDAFRRRGIYPGGVRTLSIESLLYREQSGDMLDQTKRMMEIITSFLRDYRQELLYETDRHEIFRISKEFIAGKRGKYGLHQRLGDKFEDSYEFEYLTGLVMNHGWKELGVRDSSKGGPSFQVLNLRLVSRVGPTGRQVNQIVVSLLQRMGVVYEQGEFVRHYVPGTEPPPEGGFEVYGGSTLIFDLDNPKLRYAISKPLLAPEALYHNQRRPNLSRFDLQYRYQNDILDLGLTETAKYFGDSRQSLLGEPFALLHRR